MMNAHVLGNNIESTDDQHRSSRIARIIQLINIVYINRLPNFPNWDTTTCEGRTASRSGNGKSAFDGCRRGRRTTP